MYDYSKVIAYNQHRCGKQDYPSYGYLHRLNTMRIKIYAPSIIDHTLLDPNSFLEVKDGTRLGKLLGILKIPLLLRPVLYCTLNHERVPRSTLLKDGDVVSIVAPISGG